LLNMQKEEAILQKKGTVITSRALTELYKNNNVTKAFRLAQYVYEQDPSNINARIALYNTIYQPTEEPVKLFYSEINTHDYYDPRIQLSPDGSKVLCFNPDNSVRIIDVQNGGKPVTIADDSIGKRLDPKNNSASDIMFDFSPSGTVLNITNTYYRDAGATDFYAKDHLYSTVSGKKILDYKRMNYYQGLAPSFSPGDQYFLVPELDGDDDENGKNTNRVFNINVFTPGNGKLIKKIELPGWIINIKELIFSADESAVAINCNGADSNLLAVYKTGTWELVVATCALRKNEINCAFSKDCKKVCIKTVHESPVFFDIDNLQPITEISSTDSFFKEFSTNAKRLVYGQEKEYTRKDTLGVYDIITGKRVNCILPVRPTPRNKFQKIFNFSIAKLSGDGERIWSKEGMLSSGHVDVLSSFPNSYALWNANTGEKILSAPARGNIQRTDYSITVFSPDSKYLLTSCMENTATLWDAHTGRQLATLAETHVIDKAVFSKDGKYILTSNIDSFVKKWPLDRILDPSNILNRADVAGVTDAVNTHNEYIRLSETKGNGGYFELDKKVNKKPWGFIVSLPHGRIFTASDNYIKVTDTTSGRISVDSLKDKKNELYGILVSPDGNYLMANFGVWKRNPGGNLSSMWITYSTLWDLNAGRILGSYNVPTYEGVFSPDSRYFLFTPYDKHNKLVDVKSGEELADGVLGTSFSKDSKMLIEKVSHYDYNDKTNESKEIIDSVSAWAIEPEDIIKKMKGKIGDLTRAEKKKYGVGDNTGKH
ncbi:MAG: repeat-containing protein, partial [Flavipsychrobacter sp.]|nr:repeat-containing protein [Flavipsychrobacter sp.]